VLKESRANFVPSRLKKRANFGVLVNHGFFSFFIPILIDAITILLLNKLLFAITSFTLDLQRGMASGRADL